MEAKLTSLRDENTNLKTKILAIREQSSNSKDLRSHINQFVEQSKKKLNEMNAKISTETAKHNEQLHGLTAAYEGTLKKQIDLLTEHKSLSEKKEAQDAVMSKKIEEISSAYEEQIFSFEKKVKANVKRIEELSGGNIINRLLRNPRFRQVMQARGCSLDSLLNQSRLEEVSNAVEEIEKQIEQAERRSAQLDEELGKMHELIDTMKELMDNMMKEKANIMKQNSILKEKLQQSQQLIAKLLGEPNAEVEEEEGNGEEEGNDEEDNEEDNGEEA